MAILKPKASSKTRTLSVRVSADLLAQVEQIRAEAEQCGLVFDVAELVEKTLAAAVKSARGELDAVPSASVPDTPSPAEAVPQ